MDLEQWETGFQNMINGSTQFFRIIREVSMRKAVILIMSLFFTFSMVACGNNKNETSLPQKGIIEKTNGDSTEVEERENASDGSEAESGSKILITYFTVPETDGVDTVAGASRVAKDGDVLGNTEFIAKEIQKNIGGDLFAMETVQEYPGEHQDLLDFAYDELEEDARPELAEQIENLNDYDVVLVGYPNWNADLPMPLYTFFETYDFTGKTIIPFVTHGGSGFSDTINTMKKLEPDATVISEGLSISRNDVTKAQEDVKEWAEALLGNERSSNYK